MPKRTVTKRAEPEAEEATPPPPSSKKKKAKSSPKTAPAAATKTSPKTPRFGANPVTLTATSYHTGTPYPPISASHIKQLKWGISRDLMLPFLTPDEQKTIHKRTRADLARLLEERVKSGDVTPEHFWKAVGLEKAKSPPTKKPVDPTVAAAVMRSKMGPAVGNPVAAYLPPPTTLRNVPSYPHPTLMGSPMSPYMPAPRPIPHLFKYTLRVPASIWPSTDYPPGMVIGEPNPPSRVAPPSVTGTFYSSSIQAIGPDDDVLGENDAKTQAGIIFSRLHSLLGQLNVTHSDVISMSAHVVDIHENGRDVLDAHEKYMAGKGNSARSICAWSMIGVSGLMPAGCMVQLEVKAIVRMGPLSSLILDRPGVKI